MDDRVRVRRLPGEVMAPGCTVGRQQAGGGSVMFWAMFCWETLGPAIHVDVNLTHVTSQQHRCRPGTPLHGNGIPWWQWPLSAG